MSLNHPEHITDERKALNDGLMTTNQKTIGLKLSGMTIEMDVSAGQYTEQQGARETFRDVFLRPGACWAVPHLRVFKA
ncbi:hypothetical protein QQF64_011904 [Cirrhinus molitorella]|uniref:Uncharacterized protein n=1 Tax=Cirrhinus molitorella TaxID=172907 RepID=A0ABR3LX58_9TELE